MDTWDEEKLRDVVLSKAGNPRTITDVHAFAMLIFRIANAPLDCLQVLYRGHRDTKVWVVLAMSERRQLSVSTRITSRLRPQVSEEGCRRCRQGQPN